MFHQANSRATEGVFTAAEGIFNGSRCHATFQAPAKGYMRGVVTHTDREATPRAHPAAQHLLMRAYRGSGRSWCRRRVAKGFPKGALTVAVALC